MGSKRHARQAIRTAHAAFATHATQSILKKMVRVLKRMSRVEIFSPVSSQMPLQHHVQRPRKERRVFMKLLDIVGDAIVETIPV